MRATVPRLSILKEPDKGNFSIDADARIDRPSLLASSSIAAARAHLVQGCCQQARTGSVAATPLQQLHPLRRRASGTMGADYYELLGVPRTATDAVLKKAYRKAETRAASSEPSISARSRPFERIL